MEGFLTKRGNAMPDEPPWFSTPRHTTSHPLDKLSMSSLKRRFRVSRPRPRPAALKINRKNKYKWATVTLCLTRDARVLKQENALPDDSPLFFTPRHTTSHPLDKLSCERRFSKCHRTPCRTQKSDLAHTPHPGCWDTRLRCALNIIKISARGQPIM